MKRGQHHFERCRAIVTGGRGLEEGLQALQEGAHDARFLTRDATLFVDGTCGTWGTGTCISVGERQALKSMKKRAWTS